MFVKISEQPSLYNDLEKKSVREILEDINTEDQKVALAVQRAIPQIEKLVTQIVPRMKQGGRIFYMGAGTSGRLGVLDASEIPPTFGMPPTLVIGLIAGGDTALRNPVENAEDDIHRGWEELTERNITDKDTVIGIAASGTTPYVIGAMHEAREHGILTGCITSNPDSPMAAEADVAIEMIVGPEYVTGSSRMKSGTGQKMILNMITTSVMIQLGRVKGNKMVNMQLSNKKLVDRGTRMIIEGFEEAGLEVKDITLSGGIPIKNEMLVQVYSDVCNRKIKVVDSTQSSALGAAILGAAAAPERITGFKNANEAAKKLGKVKDKVWEPNQDNVEIYNELYEEYKTLHGYFGTGINDVMKHLNNIRERRK